MSLKSRMERYVREHDEVKRTKKNQDLYEDIYNNAPSSTVSVLDNESEIDISKIKELIDSREGYNRVKKYQEIIQTKSIEEESEEYDIYEDIDNKIYDINKILEDAKAKREISEREKYRGLRNTQYNILSKLELNEEPEKEEMATDFFTQDKTIEKLMKEQEDHNSDDEEDDTTSKDLFDDLKSIGDTVLTEAVDPDKVEKTPKHEEEESTFYTNRIAFANEDFEGLNNLQTTIKKNNKLIKVLITIVTFIVVAIIVFVTFTLL